MLVRFLLVICGWSFVVVGGFIALAWFSALANLDLTGTSNLSLGILTFGGSLMFIPLISVGSVLLGIDKIIDELQLLNKKSDERLSLEKLQTAPISYNDVSERSAPTDDGPRLTAKR